MTEIDRATARRVLALPLPEHNDAGAATVRDYLTRLLALVWEHDECFDGKRPFGSSGWAGDLYYPLVKAGLIDGDIDEDGYLEAFDHRAGDALIAAAIVELGHTDEQPAEPMTEIEKYAIETLSQGGEGIAEDDLNEAGGLDDDSHQEACALSVAMAHTVRDNGEAFLAWFRQVSA